MALFRNNEDGVNDRLATSSIGVSSNEKTMKHRERVKGERNAIRYTDEEVGEEKRQGR